MKNLVAIKPEDERISERARYIAAVAKAVALRKPSRFEKYASATDAGGK